MSDYLINNSLVLSGNISDENKQQIKETLNRLLLLTAGFSATTSRMDFATNILIDKRRGISLSLYCKNEKLYIGLYNRNTHSISLNVSPQIYRKINANIVDVLIRRLVDSENHYNLARRYNINMHNPAAYTAWNKYLSQNPTLKPAHVFDYQSKTTNIARKLYECYSDKDIKEIANWIFRENPTVQEKENVLKRALEQFYKKVKEIQNYITNSFER